MNQPIPSPRMFRPEVCAKLRISKSHLYNLHNRGILMYRKDGGRTFWLRSEVEAYAVSGC